MKLRLVRLNPLTLDPGELVLMGARSMDGGEQIFQFPVRLEYWCTQLEDGMFIPEDQGSWQPVEFSNEFQSNEDNDARKVRPEVQVPVYTGSTRTKKRGGDSGGGQP